MISSENLLGIPRANFGTTGICTGNIISRQVANQGKGYKAEYNPSTSRITVLNSSDLPPSVLSKILYENRSEEYFGFYPVVADERDPAGDLVIRLSNAPPSIVPKEEVPSKEEIAEAAKAISSGVVETMNQYFNKHEEGNGVWYPRDYSKYLMDVRGVEMPESYFTGYANEEFFEKSGPFTFTLKEGKTASDALLSFLRGPTVADCANATMACHYKCVLDIIGEEKFNEVFSFNSRFPLIIGQNGIMDPKLPLFHFSEFTQAAMQGAKGVLGRRPLRVGDECHFGGVFCYANKHPEGFGGGYNVVYMGDNEEGCQLFLGHGFEKPLTEKEINQWLIELYNEERTPQDERRIALESKPEIYDRNESFVLNEFYTVSPDIIYKNFNEYMRGFISGSVKSIKAEKIAGFKKCNNTSNFMIDLVLKNAITNRVF